jgi:hypothetical protein
MYLRHKNTLDIKTIVEQWARERPDRNTGADVLSELLQAFWLGSLTGLRQARDRAVFSRKQGLQVLVAQDANEPHPGILICQTKEQVEARVVRNEDGSVDADPRVALLLPADRRKWSQRILEAAWGTLSCLEASAYSANFLEGFQVLRMDRLDFLDFIRRRDLEPPAFWFHPKDPLRGLSGGRTKPRGQTKASKVGAPFKYDYAPIDRALDTLRRKKGRSAFDDRGALHRHVQNELGDRNVPKRTTFDDHLRTYISEHFES